MTLEEIKKDLENTSSLYGEIIPVNWVYDYIDKAFAAGRLQALSEAEGETILDMSSYLAGIREEGHLQGISEAEGVVANDKNRYLLHCMYCRKQTLDNIARLKGKE